MDQMQLGLLYMLQQTTAVKTNPAKEAQSNMAEESDFRKLMEKQTETVETKKKPEQPEQQKTAEEKSETTGNEEIDVAVLQELAAMQMMYVDTAQIVKEQEPMTGDLQTVLNVEEALPVDVEPYSITDTAEKQTQPDMQPENADKTVASDAPVTAMEKNTDTQGYGNGEMNLQKEQQTPAAERNSVEDVTLKTTNGQEENAEVPVFENVETAPVKVSETAVPAEAKEAKPVEAQITEKLMQTIAAGKTKVELQLTPENLGKVVIEVVQKDDGTLRIAIQADNSLTRSLLERDVSGLQTLLSRTTQQEVQVQVDHTQEHQQQETYDGHQQQGHQQQEHRQRRQSSQDFLNQLRLGLIPLEEAAS